MSTLTERLQLVVDATTSSAEARFDRLTASARETGDASVRSAADVASAADRVLSAQAKQADAAGQVAVAEKRLQELRDKGNASASQLEAAEQRLESAKRKLHLASREVANATEAEERATRGAVDAQQDAQQEARDYGSSLDDLKGKVAGLAAGALGLEALRGTVDQFVDGARGAGQLARSMNATTAEAGALNTLMGSLGLEMDDLLEIQAEFAGVIEATPEALDEMGASVKRNRDGTINWALTLEDALAQLQQVPDATERNRRGFALFGEEGYKQLSRLLLSGTSVKDALEQIGTPFDDDDVAAAAEYDAAMMDLSLTSGNTARVIGGTLLPVVTGVMEGVGALVDVVSGVPLPMGLAAGAAIALGFAQRSAAVEGGVMAGVLAGAQGIIAGFTTRVAGATVGTGILATTMGVARVAGAGLLTVLGGPIGIAILALGAAFTFLNSRTEENDEAAQDAAQANQDLAQALRASHGVITATVRQQAALSAQQTGLLDSAEAAGVATSQLTNGLLGNAEAYDTTRQQMLEYADSLDAEAQALQVLGTASEDEIKSKMQQATAVRESVGEYETLRGTVTDQVEAEQQLAAATDETTDKQQLATAAMDALKAAMDQGGTSAEDLTELTAAAAEAQVAAALASERAEAAIAAYRAQTDQAVQATLDLISAQLSLEDAEYGYLDAMDALAAARDDEKTSVDEVAQAHTRYKGAALDAAQAAADAAVEAATAAGQVVGPLEEAQIRADAMLANLREKLNTPGLSEGAQADLQGLVDQLQAAKDKGDVQAIVTLTGAQEAETELDDTTEDREAHINVESRGGPAVIRYLDTIASTARLALIRVESRGGPAADSYLDSIAAADRLAIIRVETRGGPAVRQYLDDLAGNYGRGWDAVVNVRRNGSGAPVTPTGAPAVAGLYGASSTTTIGQLVVQVAADGSGRLTQTALAEAGRSYVAAIRKYEQQNGTGWRRTP